MVSSDAHVLENEGSDEEAVGVGEGIEAGSDACGVGDGVKAVGEINRWPGDGGRSKSLTEKSDVVELILSNLNGVLLKCGCGESDLSAANHGSRTTARVCGGKTRTRRSPKVELGLKVFEVEREVEDVCVRWQTG